MYGTYLVETRRYANLHADLLTPPLVPGIMRAEARMATKKKATKKAAKKKK